MSAEVVDLNFVAGRDTTAALILPKAIEADLEHCVVLGWDKDGDFFFSSSYAAGPEILWLLEVARIKLMHMGPDTE